MTAAPGRPVTYATGAQARAYVAAVVAARAGLAALGPAYVAMSPAVAMTGRWPVLRETLAGLLPGVPLAEWDTMPAELRAAQVPRAERAERLAAGHRALVVVALRETARRELTGGVLAEARAFADAGRPVIVFTGRRLAAWADCRTRPAPGRRRQVAAWLDVPPAPPRPLPTLAASLWALGVADPAAVARASAGVPGGAPGGPGPDVPPPAPRPPAGRPAPPAARFRPAAPPRRTPMLAGGRAWPARAARPAGT